MILGAYREDNLAIGLKAQVITEGNGREDMMTG